MSGNAKTPFVPSAAPLSLSKGRGVSKHERGRSPFDTFASRTLRANGLGILVCLKALQRRPEYLR
jgi:hypothetical protein